MYTAEQSYLLVQLKRVLEKLETQNISLWYDKDTETLIATPDNDVIYNDIKGRVVAKSSLSDSIYDDEALDSELDIDNEDSDLEDLWQYDEIEPLNHLTHLTFIPLVDQGDYEYTTENIPQWAVNYLINGDATDLNDEEIKMIDEYTKENFPNGFNIEIPEETHFSNSPAFGEPAMVYEAIIITPVKK